MGRPRRDVSVVALVALALSGLGCGSRAVVGEECTGSSDCMAGLSCINRPGAAITPVCMADCDRSTTVICDDGSVCLERVSGGAGVCYLGGTGADGTACEGALDCRQGSVCVSLSDESQVCARACDVADGSRCGPLQTCTALVGGGGFCEDT